MKFKILKKIGSRVKFKENLKKYNEIEDIITLFEKLLIKKHNI